MGVCGGYCGVGKGGAERVCEWVEGDRGEHVCDDGQGDYGSEGVCGEEDWRDAALSGESCLVVRMGKGERDAFEEFGANVACFALGNVLGVGGKDLHAGSWRRKTQQQRVHYKVN